MIVDSEEAAREYCADLTDGPGMARLERFATLLVEENARQNLIAKTSETSLWTRHFADSAQLLEHVPRGTTPWIDLGTGAGFPGLVIAAMETDRPCILVESRRKRADFLAAAVEALALRRCTVRGVRLENVEDFAAGVISARAFAPLEKLLALSARFSTRDTFWVLPKGRSAGQELVALPERSRSMFHVEHSITDPEAGILVGKGNPQTP